MYEWRDGMELIDKKAFAAVQAMDFFVAIAG